MSDVLVDPMGQPVYRNDKSFEIDVPTLNGGGRKVGSGCFIIGDYYNDTVEQCRGVFSKMPEGFMPPKDRVVAILTLGSAREVLAGLLGNRPSEVKTVERTYAEPKPQTAVPLLESAKTAEATPESEDETSDDDDTPNEPVQTVEATPVQTTSVLDTVNNLLNRIKDRPKEPPMPKEEREDEKRIPLSEAGKTTSMPGVTIHVPRKDLKNLPEDALRKLAAHYGTSTTGKRKDILRALEEKYPENP